MKTSHTLAIQTCLFVALFLDLTGANPIFAQSKDDVHITENTTWSGNVNVSADTYIDEGVSLTINPGTAITFTGFYGLQVIGNIIAEGTPTDSIHFIPSNTSTGWNRIMFEFTASDSDSSKFSYCSFQYSKALDDSYLGGEAGGAMYLNYFEKISIQNCLFKNNYALSLGGALFFNYSSPHIINNIFDNNSADIDAGAIGFKHSSARLIGNLFINNQTTSLGGALDITYSSPVITNNTFADNHAGYSGGAVCININSEPVFTNCIFFDNSATVDGNEIAFTDNAGNTDFYYCLLSGGIDAFGGDWASHYEGNYENNIDTDPIFQGNGDTPYNISVASPCLNSGTPDLSGLHLPALDLAGNPRIAEGCEERIDIGAYENQSQATNSAAGILLEDAHWCADTVFITGDITVNDGVTLTIEKGTVIYIAGAYSIDIKGSLRAIGAQHDSIAFTTDNIWPYWFWGGIKFHNIEAENDSSIIRYCRFNLASCPSYTGAAISIDNWNKIEISSSWFNDNNTQYGGAIAINNASITLNNCLINNNTGIVGGGLYASNSTLSLISCTVDDNKAKDGNCNFSMASHGGGIYLKNCTTTITNCTITNNKADCKGGGIYSNDENLQLQNSNISHNQAGVGGGMFLNETSGELNENVISHNTASNAGGISVSGGSLTISKNQITHNYAIYDAAMYVSNCNPNIINNLISENHAGTAGGGIAFNYASPFLLNNTLANNYAANFAGCIHFGSNSNASPTFKNCIIYGNYVINTDGENGENVFMFDDSGQANFYYCDLEGGVEGFGGYFNNYTGDFENNIDMDPVFKNSGDHPYQLAAFSPCINTADASTTSATAGTTDLARNPRILNGRIDMGSYENERDAVSYPGKALHFTENDDLVVLENESHFDFTESFTIEFWMNCDNMSDDNHLILKKGNAWAFNLFYSEAIALPDFSLDSNGVFGYYQTTGTALLNQWNHIAGVCKKRAEGGFEVSIYFNGKQGTADVESFLTHNNSPVTIGNDFLGKIDELRIWDKALTEQEIRESMHLIISPEQENLLAYHQFNRDFNGVLVDIAGGNNASLQNMNATECLVGSTVPAAKGASKTQLVDAPGIYDFTGTDVRMNFSLVSTANSVVVSRLDTVSNIDPPDANEVFGQYWIIEKYGEASFDADLTFWTLQDLTTLDEAHPDLTRLYTRGNNSDGIWTFVDHATAIDTSQNTAQFDGIDQFSQFCITRKLIPDRYAGNALEFDGDEQFVSIDPIYETSPQGLSIEAWIVPENLQSSEAYIFYHGDNGEVGLLVNNQYTKFRIKLSDGSWHNLAVAPPETGTWQHVCGVWDASGSIKLFVDGTLADSLAVPTLSLYDPGSNYLPSIGAHNRQRNYFEGKIDELRLWNVARTVQQIREKMCTTLDGIEDGLMAYWQFNSDSGTSASDVAGNHTGTLVNMDSGNRVISTAPLPFQSVLDGNWSSDATWLENQTVPVENWSQVRISSDVLLDQNQTLINLSIDSSKSLTLNSGSHLTITDSLKNAAGESGLILKSDALATASIVNNTPGNAGTVQRYIPKYIGSAGWHDISSPVAAQAIRPEFVNSGTPNPENDFYKFNEPQYLWINTKAISGNWNSNFEDNFVVGRGYNVAYADDETKTFAGALNVGDFTFDETTNPAITYTADGGIGWNLMGNPYPSAFDWDLCNRTNIDASVYAYDGDAGQYLSWNGSIGALTQGIIPPMNGFFIKASSNASLTIPYSARAHTSTNFYKAPEYVQDLLVLKVEGNGFTDRTYINFNADATIDFDTEFDAYKLSGIFEAPQLYTKSGQSKLSINVIPYNSEEIIIPLSLKVGNETEYTISVNEYTFWETVDILLKDLETEKIYDLRTIKQLTIKHSPESFSDRFLLLIKGATGIQENPAEDDSIEIYSFGNEIFIKTDGNDMAQLALYNLLGQNILSQNIRVFETLSGLDMGFYLIVVKTGKGTKTKKIFIR